jgi:hypothetical protein
MTGLGVMGFSDRRKCVYTSVILDGFVPWSYHSDLFLEELVLLSTTLAHGILLIADRKVVCNVKHESINHSHSRRKNDMNRVLVGKEIYD